MLADLTYSVHHTRRAKPVNTLTLSLNHTHSLTLTHTLRTRARLVERADPPRASRCTNWVRELIKSGVQFHHGQGVKLTILEEVPADLVSNGASDAAGAAQ